MTEENKEVAPSDEPSNKTVVPITLQTYEDEKISLMIGPTSIEDLAGFLDHIGTPEGAQDFLGQLRVGIELHDKSWESPSGD